jgi:hypothetical protein
MPFVPTPPGQLPDPDTIKTWLDPESGEGAEGYITPADLKDVVQALASYDAAVQQAAIDHADAGDASLQTNLGDMAMDVIANTDATALLATEIGNIHLIGQADLVAAILSLDARIAAIEALDITPQPPAPPTSEGEVVIDKYSGSFIRGRAGTGLDLSDGLDHWFIFALATTAGPGGEAYASIDDIPQQGSAVWFDDGGQLGHVKAVTGADLMSNSLINYMRGSTNHGARLCRGRLDKTTDPAHPNLLLQEVQR